MTPGAQDNQVPPDPWRGPVTRYGTIADACAAGVEAEIDGGGWRGGGGRP